MNITECPHDMYCDHIPSRGGRGACSNLDVSYDQRSVCTAETFGCGRDERPCSETWLVRKGLDGPSLNRIRVNHTARASGVPTHGMDLTLRFRLANFLAKNYKVFDTVAQDIRNSKTRREDRDRIARVLSKYGPDNLLRHPDTLVNGMTRDLGDKATWDIVLGIFSMHKPNYAAFVHIDLATFGLAKLKEYLYDHDLTKLDIRQVILDSFWDLSESELDRVKVLLSWGIIIDGGHIPFQCHTHAGRDQLIDQVFSTYSDHTVYVMCLIFNQILRLDLVEKLTAAASRHPLQNRDRTRIGPTRMFKMANYLRRGEHVCADVLENIQANRALARSAKKLIVLMFEEYGADTLLKHPETLVNAMTRYLGTDVTWDILAGSLHRCQIDFSVTDLHAHGLDRLGMYDRCDTGGILQLVQDALLKLREMDNELERVKLLLSWGIVSDCGTIPLRLSEQFSLDQLAWRIVTTYSYRTVYVMCLIFTQIGREDLVETLTAAARVGLQCDTKAMS